MEKCIHELDTISCADCRPRRVKEQMVYATPGGSVVHRRQDCELLERGQAAVDAAGGRIGVINPVHRDKYPGRGDCAWCTADIAIGSCSFFVNDELVDGIIINTRSLGYGHTAYLVRFENSLGKVIEKQFKRSQFIEFKMGVN